MLAALELATAQGLDAMLEIRGPALTAAEHDHLRRAAADRFAAVPPSEAESLSSRPSREMRSRHFSPAPTFFSARRSPKGARRSTRSCTRRARRAYRCSRAMSRSTSSSPTCRSGCASPDVTPPTWRERCSRSRRPVPRCAAEVGQELRRRVDERSFGGVVGGCGAAGARRRSQGSPVPPEYDLTVPANVAPPTRRPETPPDSSRGEPRDIRSSRPRPLTRSSLGWGARRLLSVAALVALDIVGFALGLMVALVVRTLLYGEHGLLVAALATGPAEWLPFLAPITVLVFLQAGLYAVARAPLGRRTRRLLARARRADRALVRARHRLRLHDDGTDPDRRRHLLARDRPLAGRLRRRSRSSCSRSPASAAGSSSSAGAEPRAPAPRAARRRGAEIGYEFVGAVAPGGRVDCRCSARRSSTCPRSSRRCDRTS